MIPRYTLPEMGAIWSDYARFEAMLRVELAVARAQAARGQIPPDALAALEMRAHVDIDRIAEIERTTDHDVIAFVSQVAESVGPEGRYLHLGLTSSDVARLSAGGIDGRENALDRRLVGQPRRVQPQSAGQAVEKFHSQFVFQVAQLPGHGRLGDVQPLGSAPDISGLSDHQEVTKMAKFHGAPGYESTLRKAVRPVLNGVAFCSAT